MGRDELQAALDLRDRKSFRDLYLQPALEAGLIYRAIPDKPNSRLQRYRLTPAGELTVWSRARKSPPKSPPQVERLLMVLQGAMGRDELQAALDLRDRKSFRELYLQPALEAGLIHRTIPDKPNSRLQRYRLTPAGEAHLAIRRQKGDLP